MGESLVGEPHVLDEEVGDCYGLCSSCDADAPLSGLKELFLFLWLPSCLRRGFGGASIRLGWAVLREIVMDRWLVGFVA